MLDLAAYQRSFVEAIDGQRFADRARAGLRATPIAGAIDTLVAKYRTVADILGIESFRALVAEFVSATTQRHPDHAAFGSNLSEWIAAQKIGHVLPYLSGVARIDRLKAEVQVAANAVSLRSQALKALTAEQWQRSRAVMHPATRFGWFSVPAPTIWLSQSDPRGSEIAPLWKAEGILLTRHKQAVTARIIGPAEHRILSGLRIGETVGAASHAAHTLYPNADITSAFHDIIDSGALSSLKSRR